MRIAIGLAAATLGLATEAAAAPELSGNIALTSDYVFRGLSQTMEEPAVQGGLDLVDHDRGYYLGVWSSNVDFGIPGATEVDLYAGVTPTLGPVEFDLGVLGYFYPSMSDTLGEADMVEFKAAAHLSPGEGVKLGGEVSYSPDFGFNGGEAWYGELNAEANVASWLAISGAVGEQKVETAGYYVGGRDKYATWNVGATATVAGFGLDLRYHDTDLDNSPVADGRVVFTLSRAL